MGISFKVVTTVKSADDVNARIEEFLLEFRKDLVSMSKETFMENVVGLAKEKLEKFNSLEEEAGNLWYEITENRYDWEMHRDEAHALRSITKEQVIKAFDDWLCPTQQSRRRLTIHAIGTKEGVSSINRPVIPVEDVGNTIDSMVKAFHKAAGNKTYGKIM
jgi:secreted Zn-dependent insulinase-like peptidase